MHAEVRPLGVKCNISCHYCYQDPQREAGGVYHSYDLEAIERGIERTDLPFTLFGGEPLLVPLADLERLWALGLKRWGVNRIQTNGTLITEEHVRLFHTYRVEVGISVDGPDELNDFRWAGDLQRTRAATARTQAAIVRLCGEGLNPRIIITLSRCNAAPARLVALERWLVDLEQLGVTSARLHILEVESDTIRSLYALSDAETLEAMQQLYKFERDILATLRFDLFSEMRNLLLGRDEATACVWNECDPYTTLAVRGIEGNGQSTNCGRMNKEGVDFVKAATPGFERYLALYQTPQEHGGCRECRFFLMCKGQCPGTASDHDARNRSAYCAVWMGLFERIEADLLCDGVRPLSVHPRLPEIERAFLGHLDDGFHFTIASTLSDMGNLETVLPISPSESNAFQMSDFNRISWVSDSAGHVWGERLRRVALVCNVLQWRAVAAGLRRCARFVCTPATFAASQEWTQYGLTSALVGFTLPSERGFFAVESADRPDVLGIEIAVGAKRDVASFCDARAAEDMDSIADLLGIPKCCAQAASGDEGLGGSTTPLRTLNRWMFSNPAEEVLDIESPAEMNILWNRLGVDLIRHPPCTPHCVATMRVATALIELGASAGWEQEMVWLREILSWPCHWSALHGIAELKTPVLKAVSLTDYTPSRRALRWLGLNYPAEGAIGISFPYTVARQNIRAGAASVSSEVAK
jgi:uncharacterized protein